MRVGRAAFVLAVGVIAVVVVSPHGNWLRGQGRKGVLLVEEDDAVALGGRPGEAAAWVKTRLVGVC